MKKLIPILKSLGINHVISLDDEYDVTTAEYKRYQMFTVNDYFETHEKEFSEEERDLINEIPAASIGEVLQREELPEVIKQKIRKSLAGKHNENFALTCLEKSFEDIPSIEWKKISSAAAVADYKESGTLWFLDKEVGERDVLPEVLEQLVLQQNRGICIVVVLTAKRDMMELNASWNKRFQYLKDTAKLSEDNACALAHSFFAISKEEVTKRSEDGYEAGQKVIARCMVNSLMGYCARKAVEEIGNFARDALKDLADTSKNIQQISLETICYNMVAEGEANIFRTFQAIQYLFQERAYHKKVSELSSLTLAMKQIVPAQPANEKEAAEHAIKNVLNQYQWTQYQFIHRDINETYADPSYGDVFKLRWRDFDAEDIECIGILVTQICDCALRVNGVRKAKEFTLLLYEEKKLEIKRGVDITEDVGQLRNSAVFLDCQLKAGTEDQREARYIDIGRNRLQGVIQIPSCLLDLSGLNEQGKAKLLTEEELEQAVLDTKTKNWKERQSELKKFVRAFREKVDMLQVSTPERAEELLSWIYKIPFSCATQEFEISRIGRLEMNLVDFANYNYVTNANRIGKNGLLALGESQETEVR